MLQSLIDHRRMLNTDFHQLSRRCSSCHTLFITMSRLSSLSSQDLESKRYRYCRHLAAIEQELQQRETLDAAYREAHARSELVLVHVCHEAFLLNKNTWQKWQRHRNLNLPSGEQTVGDVLDNNLVAVHDQQSITQFICRQPGFLGGFPTLAQDIVTQILNHENASTPRDPVQHVLENE
jgi:hypothetical protein